MAPAQNVPQSPITVVTPPAPSFHYFRTADRRPRSRTKLTVEEREKVLGVRRQGACLRCRILKIQCSVDNPCQPCLQSAVKGFERKVLSFCYCVRTRFADVNIFDSPWQLEGRLGGSSGPGRATATTTTTTTMQIDTLMQRMSALLARIATPAHFSLTSHPAAFNNALFAWLTDPDFHLPNGSIVGLCCSSLLGLQFPAPQQERGNDEDDDGLLADFRRFVLATSLVHAGWRDSSSSSSSSSSNGSSRGFITTRDLCAVGQASGARLLRRLDRVLTPQFLARCGRDSCQVLFLLVLGAVLGVGYSSPSHLLSSASMHHRTLISPEFQRSPTLWLAMKEHLCQMLAHHLVFVGSMLGIRMDTGLEQRIIDTAVRRWHKAEQFVWADVVGLPSREEGSSSAAAEGLPGTAAVDPKSEAGEAAPPDPGLHEPPSWSNPPRMAPQLVPIHVPELRDFQPRTTEDWSENPTSYLAMFDKPESGGFSGLGSASEDQRTADTGNQTGPEARSKQKAPEHIPPRERKRRSIWLVRPFDAGPEGGFINVHARLQGGMGMESLRAFV
ncbi:uncharacterized protein B0T15DRAFT_481087 [Chaetomium strumarium]|uniref:Zn(2)-C6 fungal-type domain-containing protein n=1 Tax=Chaetomium strumarium TaxID=1170767 RepID=A0AAJ0H045_9PEZI|nr:hypothetical protein B0T15DRAFT_481087 [Chaetomium strumarium]